MSSQNNFGKPGKAVDELFLAKTPWLQFVGKSILTT
jgi:hypothetical protein